MKKSISMLLVLLIIVFSSFISFAEDCHTLERSTPDENGCYFETIIEDVNDGSTPIISSLFSSNYSTTTTKSKTTYYKNASGDVLWYVRVTGTFKYGNGSSTCISASVKAESQHSSWTVHNISSSKTANKAIGKATGKLHQAGVVINTITKTVTLTCSPTGQFS